MTIPCRTFLTILQNWVIRTFNGNWLILFSGGNNLIPFHLNEKVSNYLVTNRLKNFLLLPFSLRMLGISKNGLALIEKGKNCPVAIWRAVSAKILLQPKMWYILFKKKFQGVCWVLLFTFCKNSSGDCLMRSGDYILSLFSLKQLLRIETMKTKNNRKLFKI